MKINMTTTTTTTTDLNSADYLTQLLKDKKQLAAFPNVFMHLERLLDEEINRIRVNLFQLGTKEAIPLPEPSGPNVQLTEKLYVPVKDHPEFNFVGRILGPRGMTAKQLEQETGCKIMVRGKGSMRDKAKEEQMKGKPNWEHLNDDLHVLITVEDTKNRAEVKIKRAVEEIKKLLVPSVDGDDELKKKQLIELAIINGKYKQEAAVAANNFQQTLNQLLLSQAVSAVPFILANSATTPTGNTAGQNQATTTSSHINALSGAPILISSATAANLDPLTAAALASLTNGTGSAAGTGANATSAANLYAAAAAAASSGAATGASSQQTATNSNGDQATGLIYPGSAMHAALYHQQTADLNAAVAAANQAAAAAAFIDYSNSGLDFSQAGPIKGQKILNGPTHLRAHPYSR